jgi:hypothetical protein
MYKKSPEVRKAGKVGKIITRKGLTLIFKIKRDIKPGLKMYVFPLPGLMG